MNFWQILTLFILPSWQKTFKLVLLAIFSIALGVALIVSVFNSNDSILAQFNYSNKLIQGKQTARLQSLTQAFKEQDLSPLLIKQLHNFDFTPVLERKVFDNTTQQVITILGIDLLNDYRFRDYAFEEKTPDVLSLIKEGGLVLTVEAKEKLKNSSYFTYGNSQIPIQISPKVTLKNIGLAQAESGLIALADIKYIQKILSEQNTFTSLDFSKALPEELKQNLSLPSGFKIIDPSTRRNEIANLTEAFRFNLQALSFIALFVSGYLIFQTIFISFQRKNKTIGILRVLGLSQSQTFSFILLEALLLGILGIILGCGLGLLLSKFVLMSLQKTINELYFSTQSAQLLFSPKGLIIGALIGLTVCILAALPSAWFSTKVSPALNLKEAAFRNFQFLPNIRLYFIYSIGGLILIFLIFLQDFLFEISNRYIGFIMALAALVGLSLISGCFLALNLNWQASLQNWFSKLFVVRLSINFLRLWIATGALICGLSMTISISIMIDSFRETVKDWVNETLKADIYISSSYKDDKSGFDESLITIASNLPEVKAVDALSKHQTFWNNKPVIIGGTNLKLQVKSLPFIQALPKLTDKVLNQDKYVIISNTFALKHKLKLNSEILLETFYGPYTVQVAGIYRDYSSEHGYILMRRELYTHLFKQSKITNMALYLSPGADQNLIRSKLPINLKVQNNAELRETVLSIFDQTFQVSYLFFWIALIISVLTVALTLFSCIEENAYLNQIKYYLGTTLKQIFSFELMQALLIICTALLLSLPGGYWLAYILKNTVNNNSFGWIIYLNPNILNIAFISGLAIIGALIGTIFPLISVYRKQKFKYLEN